MNYENTLLQKLHFTIGEEFEKNEFNVKTGNSFYVDALEYESYTYIKGDIKSILGLNINSIQLFYNADVLCAVKYEFNANLQDKLRNKINSYVPPERIDIYKNTIKYHLCNNIHILLEVKENIINLYCFKSLENIHTYLT